MGVIYNRNRKKGLFYIPSGGLGPSVSADFAYSKSSFNQGEADPTPTITGTAGGSFNADAGVVFVDTGSFNSSTGQIDLSATTIDSHIITYTVDGVQSGQTVGVTAIPYQSTSSFTFDGVNDYFEVSNKFDFVQQTGIFSVSCWIKLDNYTSTNLQEILNTNNIGRAYDGWRLFYDNRGVSGSYNDKVIGFYLYGVNGTNSGADLDLVYKDNAILDNDWHHIAVVGSPAGTYGTLTLYIDGVSVGTRALLDNSLTTGTANNDLRIGDYNNNYNLDGNIDEVSIWNSALSSDAITEIAAGPNDLTSLSNASNTNLKAWYKF